MGKLVLRNKRSSASRKSSSRVRQSTVSASVEKVMRRVWPDKYYVFDISNGNIANTSGFKSTVSNIPAKQSVGGDPNMEYRSSAQVSIKKIAVKGVLIPDNVTQSWQQGPYRILVLQYKGNIVSEPARWDHFVDPRHALVLHDKIYRCNFGGAAAPASYTFKDNSSNTVVSTLATNVLFGYGQATASGTANYAVIDFVCKPKRKVKWNALTDTTTAAGTVGDTFADRVNTVSDTTGYIDGQVVFYCFPICADTSTTQQGQFKANIQVHYEDF